MIPSNADNVEFVNYWFDQASKEEIKKRFEELAYFEQENEGLEEEIENRYESALEQSEFRRDAIEQILELCKTTELVARQETRELIAEIKLLVENSYVEL